MEEVVIPVNGDDDTTHQYIVSNEQSNSQQILTQGNFYQIKKKSFKSELFHETSLLDGITYVDVTHQQQQPLVIETPNSSTQPRKNRMIQQAPQLIPSNGKSFEKFSMNFSEFCRLD